MKNWKVWAVVILALAGLVSIAVYGEDDPKCDYCERGIPHP